MPQQVVNGAMLACSFGVAPSSLVVLPIHFCTAGGQPAANIMDYVPMVNIMPFGMCMTPSNPEVASATAAAMGVLTPMPCIPVVVAPWTPGAAQTVLSEFPSLDNISTCECTWGGVITITFAGQVTVEID